MIDQTVCWREMVSMREEFDVSYLPTTVMFWEFWAVVCCHAIENHLVGLFRTREDYGLSFLPLVLLVVRARKRVVSDRVDSLPREEQDVLVC